MALSMRLFSISLSSICLPSTPYPFSSLRFSFSSCFSFFLRYRAFRPPDTKATVFSIEDLLALHFLLAFVLRSRFVVINAALVFPDPFSGILVGVFGKRLLSSCSWCPWCAPPVSLPPRPLPGIVARRISRNQSGPALPWHSVKKFGHRKLKIACGRRLFLPESRADERIVLFTGPRFMIHSLPSSDTLF